MSDSGEQFLSRWSRLKREARQAEAPEDAPPSQEVQPGPAAAEPAAEPREPLPPVESLTPESDFRPFMASDVAPELRRTALKKLFADAHFNAPTLFEAYMEDYTKAEPIPAAMLAGLEQARRLLQVETPAAPPGPAPRGEAGEARDAVARPSGEDKDVAPG
jgi:hypothetical protein